ncbi:MAG: hypothetical protein IPM82_19865 [Saprospiraceae bacterium]|nr:hypothetical protein [Saprospiraceae bacterium]
MEAIYKRSFGKAAYTDSKLFNLLSGICRQVEDFLVVKMLLSEDGTSEKGRIWKELLVKALGNRNAGAYFRVEAQRLIDETNSRPVKELDDYFTLQQLHHQVYFNPDTPKYSEYPPRLQLAMEHLDLFYCIAKLQYAAEMKARERLFQVQYELPLLQAVMERTADPNLIDSHPMAAIYSKLVKLYLNGVTEVGFWDLKAMFDNKFALLPKSDQQGLLLHLINMGISLGVRDVDECGDALAL